MPLTLCVYYITRRLKTNLLKKTDLKMHLPKLIVFLQLKRFVLLLIILLVSFFVFSFKITAQTDLSDYKIRKVVIDAGHGGKDSGARGKSSYEKDIALAIALKLGYYIEKNIKDVEVIYTRKTDVFIELYQRGDIANKAKADLFISIHANSFPQNSRVAGTETYVMGLHTDERNFEVAKKENSVITFEEDYTSHYEGFDPNSAESYIIFSLMQNAFLEQSADFASNVQEQFKTKAKRKDRGVRQAGFVVLWRTSMPSVLIETGYISNPTEEAYLKSKTGQEYLASAIYRAFKNYKSEIESKSHFTQTITEQESFFKVQIASSKLRIPLDSPTFKNYKDVVELESKGRFKYAIGNMISYDDILEFNKKVRVDFKDSFIIAVRKGEIIPLSDALKNNN